MSWRTLVISNRAKLDLHLNHLVVRGEKTSKIFLEDISVLIIETTAVSITAALLNELVKHKVKVIFCDEKRNPIADLAAYYGSHDTSEKIRQQIRWSLSIKECVWTAIVIEKIRQQKWVLEKLQLPEAAVLNRYIENIQPNDITNCEAHAAKVYFAALFSSGFSRVLDIPINAALNYGYTVLLSLFNREITANGYITQLGIFHDNMFNRFNLSSDLMEPFRPLVDAEVIRMKPQKFDHTEKMQILDIFNKKVVINKQKHYVTNAVSIFVHSVFDALNKQDVSLIKFYCNEL